VLGKYDMTMLDEPPYDPEVWEETSACAIPSTAINILINHKLPERAPEVVALLEEYEVNQDILNKALFFMKDNDATTEETAMWFLENYEDLWTTWLPADKVEAVKAAM
jgi:glycine betaine/proline transport system substrate-binding protein